MRIGNDKFIKPALVIIRRLIESYPDYVSFEIIRACINIDVNELKERFNHLESLGMVEVLWNIDKIKITSRGLRILGRDENELKKRYEARRNKGRDDRGRIAVLPLNHTLEYFRRTQKKTIEELENKREQRGEKRV